MSLKTDHEWENAHRISRELYAETGVWPFVPVQMPTIDGKHTTVEVVDEKSFSRLCKKLSDTRAELERVRAELEQERAKKWWQFWK